jgi:peptidoglycan/xylan/chitin deacetylase (PgdA/CDA1 family)
VRQAVIRAGLEALYWSGLHRAARGLIGGVGLILTLHHVRPARDDAFQPNRLLEVTPEFLEGTIVALRDSGVEWVSLDEMRRRLVDADVSGRFACLTLDDGYRDNLAFAYPILKRHAVPFAIYVATSFADGEGDLWWLALEDAVARASRIEVTIGGEPLDLPCAEPAEKRQAFATLYWRLRALADETEMRASIRSLAERHGALAPAARCTDLCMSWSEIRELAADPLATIGAHTVNHVMLRKAGANDVRREMAESAETIERMLGRRPAHFSYPVGDPTSAGPREFAIAKELGFATAVTTRPGVLFPQHKDHLTALPRISLNGEFQRLRYVDVLASGAASALWNRFRKLDVA